MQIDHTRFTKLDFAAQQPGNMPGEAGTAASCKQIDAAGIRMRVVDYAPGFVGDHWCELGHFGLVLSGEVTIEFTGREPCRIGTGEGFLVSTGGDAPHRVSAPSGGRMLLLD